MRDEMHSDPKHPSNAAAHGRRCHRVRQYFDEDAAAASIDAAEPRLIRPEQTKLQPRTGLSIADLQKCWDLSTALALHRGDPEALNKIGYVLCCCLAKRLRDGGAIPAAIPGSVLRVVDANFASVKRGMEVNLRRRADLSGGANFSGHSLTLAETLRVLECRPASFGAADLARVRTSSGVEGWLKTEYLMRLSASPSAPSSNAGGHTSSDTSGGRPTDASRPTPSARARAEAEAEAEAKAEARRVEKRKKEAEIDAERRAAAQPQASQARVVQKRGRDGGSSALLEKFLKDKGLGKQASKIISDLETEKGDATLETFKGLTAVAVRQLTMLPASNCVSILKEAEETHRKEAARKAEEDKAAAEEQKQKQARAKEKEAAKKEAQEQKMRAQADAHEGKFKGPGKETLAKTLRQRLKNDGIFVQLVAHLEGLDALSYTDIEPFCKNLASLDLDPSGKSAKAVKAAVDATKRLLDEEEKEKKEAYCPRSSDNKHVWKEQDQYEYRYVEAFDRDESYCIGTYRECKMCRKEVGKR